MSALHGDLWPRPGYTDATARELAEAALPADSSGLPSLVAAGVTNGDIDTQAAFNAALASSGNWFAPPGVYRVQESGGICLSRTGSLTLRGAGMYQTRIKLHRNTTDLSGLVITNGGEVEIADLTIEDWSAAGSGSLLLSILGTATRVRLRNVRLIGRKGGAYLAHGLKLAATATASWARPASST